MLSFLSPILVICSLLFSVNFTYAQSRGQKKELIMHTDELQPFRVFRISQQLSAMDGVYFWGYLSQSQALLITYDEDKIADPQIIKKTIEHFNQETCMVIKEGTTIFSMIDSLKKAD